MTKNKNKWFLKGGRGSGRTVRLLCEVYENKIAELERKLEQAEKDLSDYQFNYPTIIELEKEKAEFKEQLARITEERNGYKITVNSYKHTIKDLRKENAGLRARLNAVNSLTPELEKISRLKKEQLTKAKDLLAKWVELFKPKLDGFPKPPIQEKTEQFLKENKE